MPLGHGKPNRSFKDDVDAAKKLLGAGGGAAKTMDTDASGTDIVRLNTLLNKIRFVTHPTHYLDKRLTRRTSDKAEHMLRSSDAGEKFIEREVDVARLESEDVWARWTGKAKDMGKSVLETIKPRISTPENRDYKEFYVISSEAAQKETALGMPSRALLLSVVTTYGSIKYSNINDIYSHILKNISRIFESDIEFLEKQAAKYGRFSPRNTPENIQVTDTTFYMAMGGFDDRLGRITQDHAELDVHPQVLYALLGLLFAWYQIMLHFIEGWMRYWTPKNKAHEITLVMPLTGFQLARLTGEAVDADDLMDSQLFADDKAFQYSRLGGWRNWVAITNKTFSIMLETFIRELSVELDKAVVRIKEVKAELDKPHPFKPEVGYFYHLPPIVEQLVNEDLNRIERLLR